MTLGSKHLGAQGAVIRTEWRFSEAEIRAAIEAVTGRRVASFYRGSGLYVTVRFADAPDVSVNIGDGARVTR